MYQKFLSNSIKFLILFLLLLVPVNVLALEPTSEFYVNDYANVLSEETKREIVDYSKSLYDKTSAQIVVVTVDTVGDSDIESYATDLFRSFGIGDKDKNNGLLILLAVNDRKSRIEVGYGLEEILNDSKTGRFQDDYMIPYYKDDDWNNGILNGYKAFYKELCDYYDISTDVVATNTHTSNDNDSYSSVFVIINFLASIILFVIIDKSRKAKFFKNFIKYIIIEAILFVIMIAIGTIFKDKLLSANCSLFILFLIINFLLVITKGKILYYVSISGGSSGGSSSGFSSSGGGSSGGGGSTRGF